MVDKATALAKHNHAVGKFLPRLKMLLQSIVLAVYHLLNLKGAKKQVKDKVNSIATFKVANAERIPLADDSVDLATIFYAFHEIPVGAREKITYDARRILKSGGTLAILDIDPTYNPPKNMLLGEPYILEYRHNIDRQLAVLPGFSQLTRKTIIPGHVVLWILTKSEAAK